jgi:hypothetical protein
LTHPVQGLRSRQIGEARGWALLDEKPRMRTGLICHCGMTNTHINSRGFGVYPAMMESQ